MPSTKQRPGRRGRASGSILSIAFFLGIVIFVALIAEKHSWRLDLTETGRFSLSSQTISILQALEEPVKIRAFFPSATPEEGQARDLLETYAHHSDRIAYEFIDPDRRPELARRYEVRSYGTLVLEGFGKTRNVSHVDEQTLTNALLRLSTEEQKKIYFLTGHGERWGRMGDKEGLSTARSALERENYLVRELSLMERQKVPHDAALLIVAGPRKPLFPEEIRQLEAYVAGGGRLMVLLDPFHDGGLKTFLEGHGVQVRDDVIVDESMGLFGGSYLMPVVTSYGRHPITDNFTFATFYPEARSLGVAEGLPPEIHVEPLAMTSPSAWGETDLEALRAGRASYDPREDHTGPLNIVLLSEIQVAQPERSSEKGEEPSSTQGAAKEARVAYVLVAGNGDFASDAYFSLSGNGDFFLNMVNFLADDETLITIEGREREGQPLLLTETQFWAMVWIVLVLVPLVAVLAGLGVYRVRRKQR